MQTRLLTTLLQVVLLSTLVLAAPKPSLHSSNSLQARAGVLGDRPLRLSRRDFNLTETQALDINTDRFLVKPGKRYSVSMLSDVEVIALRFWYALSPVPDDHQDSWMGGPGSSPPNQPGQLTGMGLDTYPYEPAGLMEGYFNVAFRHPNAAGDMVVWEADTPGRGR